eukprot:GHVR01163408.1.p1 GENE.GHVR01163408.1~~GHVR01163408.1.p1  ORF type:complete len:149 (+),score=13.69 GHVR01163408.1:310-756(+)
MKYICWPQIRWLTLTCSFFKEHSGVGFAIGEKLRDFLNYGFSFSLAQQRDDVDNFERFEMKPSAYMDLIVEAKEAEARGHRQELRFAEGEDKYISVGNFDSGLMSILGLGLLWVVILIGSDLQKSGKKQAKIKSTADIPVSRSRDSQI